VGLAWGWCVCVCLVCVCVCGVLSGACACVCEERSVRVFDINTQGRGNHLVAITEL
jgi:hypothetical protein